MSYKYLHVVLYLSYKCNLRCSYCVICFDDKIIDIKYLDNLIIFVERYVSEFDTIFVEFIGGEPLLCQKEILHLLKSSIRDKIKFQITTNGLIIDNKIYTEIIKNLDIVNLSYNEIYFRQNSLFHKISEIILDKSKVNINFIYDPKTLLVDIKRNFLLVMKEGYRNFNILPIVLVYNYSEEDFKNLLEFIQFVETFSSKLNLSYLYYLQEKSGHFEFTIDPNGDILGDNMGTAEEFFKLKQRKDKIIGKIGEVLLEDIESGLSSYSYIDYLKNITESEKSKQSYTNLLKLSNLLKKYDKKISIRNRIY